MRTTLFATLLLACSAIAFVPSATATTCAPEEGQYCPPPPHPMPFPDCRKVPELSPVVVVSDACHVYVEVDVIDCLWGEERRTVDVQVVHITYTTCAGPETMSQAPPCTCPPPPQPCGRVNDLVADNDDAVDWSLSDSCRAAIVIDVTEIVSCVYGHDAYLHAGPVTVVYPVCESPCGAATCPPPAMADPFPTCVRECSPLPMDACELRALTPAPLQTALWGQDCTVDVHTACLGGSSDSTDARIGFVDVSLARCDTPDWS